MPNSSCASLSLFVFALFAAEPAKLAASRAGDVVTVTLTRPALPAFQHEVAGRELLLTFDAALEVAGADELLKQWATDIDVVATGYDTLLLRSVREATFEVAAGAEGIVIAIRATRRDAPATQSLDGRLRVLALRASVESQIGRNRRAEKIFREARTIDPANSDLAASWGDFWSGFRPRAGASFDRKSVGSGWTENLARLQTEVALASGWRAGVTFDQNFFSVDQVRRPGTGVVESLRSFRQRGEFFAEYETEGGLRARGVGFSAAGRMGGGAHFARPDSRGLTTLVVESGRPFWEFLEGLADGGTRDRIAVERQQRIFPGLTAWIGTTASRYGYSLDRDAARTRGLSGGASYAIPATRGHVFAQYGFDGEYLRFVRTRIGANGFAYQPIPFLSREVHAAGGGGNWTWKRSFAVEGGAGMSLDRLGGRGPYLTGRLAWDRLRTIRVELFFEQRLNTINTGSSRVTHLGAAVTVRF